MIWAEIHLILPPVAGKPPAWLSILNSPLAKQPRGYLWLTASEVETQLEWEDGQLKQFHDSIFRFKRPLNAKSLTIEYLESLGVYREDGETKGKHRVRYYAFAGKGGTRPVFDKNDLIHIFGVDTRTTEGELPVSYVSSEPERQDEETQPHLSGDLFERCVAPRCCCGKDIPHALCAILHLKCTNCGGLGKIFRARATKEGDGYRNNYRLLVCRFGIARSPCELFCVRSRQRHGPARTVVTDSAVRTIQP